eukprot:106380-Karenia_brevis.AAC.1
METVGWRFDACDKHPRADHPSHTNILGECGMIMPKVGFKRSGGGRSFRDPPKPADGDASTISR